MARGRGIGQVPAVDLDRERASVGQRVADLVGQGTVRLGLVDRDPEDVLEIRRVRLEERPLIGLEVQSRGHAEDRERIVATSVDQLDDEVRVAVRLGVGPVRPMEPVAAVGGRVDPERRRRPRPRARSPVEPERGPDVGRPRREIQAVRLKEGEHDPLVAEPETRGVDLRSVPRA